MLVDEVPVFLSKRLGISSVSFLLVDEVLVVDFDMTLNLGFLTNRKFASGAFTAGVLKSVFVKSIASLLEFLSVISRRSVFSLDSSSAFSAFFIARSLSAENQLRPMSPFKADLASSSSSYSFLILA